MRIFFGQTVPIWRDQPPSRRLRPALGPHLVIALHCPIIKLLADTLDPAAPAAIAYGVIRRSKGTSSLPPLALPAALGASANLSSLERG